MKLFKFRLETKNGANIDPTNILFNLNSKGFKEDQVFCPSTFKVCTEKCNF